MFRLLLVLALLGWFILPKTACGQVMTLDQAVAEARRVNPQVRATRYRSESARSQIIQKYTPAEPQFLFNDEDSWRGFLYGSGAHALSLTDTFQFPGKSWLQGRQAQRSAEIARLTYYATLRDVTAQVKTAYYQIQLDLALDQLLKDNAANLNTVLKVTQIAYTANNATQGDYIDAKFALEADRELVRQQVVTIANDKTSLNVLLDRNPDEPVEVDKRFDLGGFEVTLDQAIELATTSRQEILEAALTEKNQDTAVTLAQLEYAPDYTLGMGFDHWLISSFAPQPNHTETWNFQVGFNLPIFFWAKNADIRAARSDLDAAREDMDSVRIQTAGMVTSLYRQIVRSRETAQLYNNTLIPLAHQAFQVMLVAYQSNKVDYTSLLNTFRQESDARATYLRAVNSVLAQKVALEQEVGGSLP